MKNLPRVLVISHTSFTASDSMGSTLAAYLSEYDPECVAQFYIKEMTPDIPVCNRFFCVTDKELVQKLRHPVRTKVGRRVTLERDAHGSIQKGDSAVADSRGGHAHRDFAMLLRNLVWSTRLWNTAEFKAWIKEFDPQVILVQPGDFSYLLKLAVELSQKFNIPLLVHQSEAYYLKPYEKKFFIYKIYRWDFARQFEKMMKRASMCVYLCDALQQDYDKCFDTPSCTIMKATPLSPEKTARPFGEGGIRFVYGGNLGLTVGRCEPLVQMGRAVKKCGSHIDVYTTSTGEHMKELTEENGIVLHGALPYDQLQEVIRQSDFVVHMENQSPWHRVDLKYAFTTKIADMLASGVCSIVYGSCEVASIRYFKEKGLGCVIEDAQDLYPRIQELMESRELREGYIEAALQQAALLHNAKANAQRMKEIIQKSVSEFGNESTSD